MVLTSTKFPSGISVHIIPSETKSMLPKDTFMWFIKELPVPTYFGVVNTPTIFITQSFADYLKKEPDFEKAFIEYRAIIEKENINAINE